MNKISEYRQVIARPNQTPLLVSNADNDLLFDNKGNKYIDFTSGWNVVNTGWNNPKVNSAVIEQLSQVSFVPSWCANEKKTEFARRLLDLFLGNRMVIPATGGTEAVEHALKIARLATDRTNIIACRGAYHGGTLGSLMLSGSSFSKDVLPVFSSTINIPLPTGKDDKWLELVLNSLRSTPAPAAILLEPIFTNPGLLCPTVEEMCFIERVARENGVILICDEVGTGFGRTGKMFAFEHFGIDPDIIVLAKAMTGGSVPAGATVIREEYFKHVRTSAFSPTYGLTPLAAAAGIAVLNEIDSMALVSRAKSMGENALTKINSYEVSKDIITDIRSWGLIFAIEFSSRVSAYDLCKRCLQMGMFVETSSKPNTILFMPPLTITESNLYEGIEIFVEAINEQLK